MPVIVKYLNYVGIICIYMYIDVSLDIISLSIFVLNITTSIYSSSGKSLTNRCWFAYIIIVFIDILLLNTVDIHVSINKQVNLL